ncbi:hypothetical protein PR048_005905 [Dryococelus australis]|uniref:Uncharacterized protein n=1 Tax=Dryococelus australis TaxID=614101 RepID=A0ABQ9I9I7_9NEOP|nr:hypothetical protein PR048_005905 [Dryococelus australis]
MLSLFSGLCYTCIKCTKIGVKRLMWEEISLPKFYIMKIFQHRKDQCDTYVSYKEGNLSEEDYRLHITKKEEAKIAKQNAISSASDDVLFVMMDGQCVLSCPKPLVRKLPVHNFSTYVSNNKDIHLYAWHEGEGKVMSNEFITCIVHFIKKNLLTCLKSTTLKSDKLFLKEDTQWKWTMCIQHKTAYSPLQYTHQSTKKNKNNNHPYIINYVDHTFFKNYEELESNFTSVRPGTTVSDPTMGQI